MIPDDLQNQGINWVAQIGPDVGGAVSGYLMGESVAFYLMPSGPSTVYAAYSTDSGGSYTQIPPNQVVQVADSNVMWLFEVPQDTQVKFLLGTSAI
jgi:hypothetical protein